MWFVFVNGNCVFYAKQVACRFKKVQVFVGIKRTQSFLKKVFFHTKEVVKHNSHVETRILGIIVIHNMQFFDHYLVRKLLAENKDRNVHTVDLRVWCFC